MPIIGVRDTKDNFVNQHQKEAEMGIKFSEVKIGQEFKIGVAGRTIKARKMTASVAEVIADDQYPQRVGCRIYPDQMPGEITVIAPKKKTK